MQERNGLRNRHLLGFERILMVLASRESSDNGDLRTAADHLLCSVRQYSISDLFEGWVVFYVMTASSSFSGQNTCNEVLHLACSLARDRTYELSYIDDNWVLFRRTNRR